MGSPRYFNNKVIGEVIRRGAAFFGPDAEAGLLETSKDNFKRFAVSRGIRTPAFQSFVRLDEATRFVENRRGPFVVKADGPARGCGVAICATPEQAVRDLTAKFQNQSSACYSGKVVIEDFVQGFEVAANIFMDDHNYVVLPPTKPHKRRDTGDVGPNVAGMGSAAGIDLSPCFFEELHDRIIAPTMEGFRQNRWRFRGCLFANLMLTDDGISVLEYNCRMGDPAMLVDLLLLKSSATELLRAVAHNCLSEVPLQFHDASAIAITLADVGYPDSPLSTQTIPAHTGEWLGSDGTSGLLIAGAASGREAGSLIVNSGVIGSAVARRSDFESARREAYRLARLLPDLHHRKDIGDSLSPPQRYALADAS
jgi:phosphoribosylamine--glycine ligase